jgi:hypothetical protein
MTCGVVETKKSEESTAKQIFHPTFIQRLSNLHPVIINLHSTIIQPSSPSQKGNLFFFFSSRF